MAYTTGQYSFSNRELERLHTLTPHEDVKTVAKQIDEFESAPADQKGRILNVLKNSTTKLIGDESKIASYDQISQRVLVKAKTIANSSDKCKAYYFEHKDDLDGIISKLFPKKLIGSREKDFQNFVSSFKSTPLDQRIEFVKNLPLEECEKIGIPTRDYANTVFEAITKGGADPAQWTSGTKPPLKAIYQDLDDKRKITLLNYLSPSLARLAGIPRENYKKIEFHPAMFAQTRLTNNPTLRLELLLAVKPPDNNSPFRGQFMVLVADGFKAAPPALKGELLRQLSIADMKELNLNPTDFTDACKLLSSNPFKPVSNYNTETLRNSVQKPPQGVKPTLSDALTSLTTTPLAGFRTPKAVSAAELAKVSDPSALCVATHDLACAKDNTLFKLQAAVCMRKGSEHLSTPKAMGEDAFALDNVSIVINGKLHQIPFIATLDGGGGHTLAQFGRDQLKTTFEKYLGILSTGQMLASTILQAMELTNNELFAKDDLSGQRNYPGRGYEQLRKNHSIIEEEIGLSVDAFKKVFTEMKANGKALSMNPLEISESMDPAVDKTVRIGNKTWDLSDQQQTNELQRYYELATGTESQIEVQFVMNTFYVNEENKLECVTFSRGDSIAFQSGDKGTMALSELPPKGVTGSDYISTSRTIIGKGDRVTSMCDGVSEVVSINQVADANSHPTMKNATPEDYVRNFMSASILTGSTDDKTVVSVLVQ